MSESPKENPLNVVATNFDAQLKTELDIPTVLPLLAIRDLVVFNYMIIPLFVGRPKSMKAVEAALEKNRYIFIATQKDPTIEIPSPDELYQTGTVGMIMRMVKIPDGRLKLLVQGLAKAKIKKIIDTEIYDKVDIELIQEPIVAVETIEQKALMRLVRENSEKVLNYRGVDSSEIMAVLNSVEEPSRLADLVAANLRMDAITAQKILECNIAFERLNMVNNQLMHEVELVSMQAKIQSMAKEGMDKAQREYYLREQLKAIKKELDDKSDNDSDELEILAETLAMLKLPEKVKKETDKQMRRLTSMHPDSSEASVVRTYLDWITEIPWKKKSRDRIDIKDAAAILNADHYELNDVKQRIVEFLSVRKLNPKMKGPILCFVGPPGVGKTSLGRSIAKALKRKFVRMSLGGMRDEAEIRGHRRTYIGSMPGRIIQAMKEAGTINPVIMLDEVDKLGNDFRGDPSSALLEVLDPEQNDTFIDHYLNVPYDLSHVMFICTANVLDTIPGPLRDRMEIIRLSGYTMQEKLEIAKRYLIGRQITENGLTTAQLKLSDAVIEKIISEYTREAGVRNLEREIGSICRKIACKVAENEKTPSKIDNNIIEKLLGIPKFSKEQMEKELPPGVAIGLAWTAYGGELLHIEVSLFPGKGTLILTGQLGDVMKESAQAALSYARANADKLDLPKDLLATNDIHIHVPAGATPKDGPSAGVTIITALLSALMNKPLNPKTAMTGEITLRGRVLPVGGIKEKILAAVSAGMTSVIMPQENKRDFDEIPLDLRKKIKVIPVNKIDDVLKTMIQ